MLLLDGCRHRAGIRKMIMILNCDQFMIRIKLVTRVMKGLSLLLNIIRSVRVFVKGK